MNKKIALYCRQTGIEIRLEALRRPLNGLVTVRFTQRITGTTLLKGGHHGTAKKSH